MWGPEKRRKTIKPEALIALPQAVPAPVLRAIAAPRGGDNGVAVAGVTVSSSGRFREQPLCGAAGTRSS